MTRKEMFTARLNTLKANATAVDCHVKPVKGTDSGNLGKVYEAEVKAYLGNFGGRAVSAQGRVDTRFHGYNVEVKQGASGLDMFFDGHKIDFVVYCPDYALNDDVSAGSYVLTRDGFLEALEEAGMIRDKVGTDGITRKAMQSYKNSNKKYNAWLDALDAHMEMTLDELREVERKGAEG